MEQGISPLACQHMADHFTHSPYIGRAQIHNKEESGLGPHKFYYVGYRDIFGVEMPAVGRRQGVEYQLWPRPWVERRISKKVLAEAMKGKFVSVRHNQKLRKRAAEHGNKFFERPKQHSESTAAPLEEKDKLPIRGKKRKRRKLSI